MLEMQRASFTWDFPMREHKEGSSHKVPRLRDKLRYENQKEKYVEAEGIGPECSK